MSQLLWATPLLVIYIPSNENITDHMTEVMYGQKKRYLVSNILYDIYDDYQGANSGQYAKNGV